MVARLGAKVSALWRGSGGLTHELLVGGLGSLTVNASATIVSLLLTIVLARTLGSEGYGIYAYVMALVLLMSVPAQLGLPNLVTRETARAQVSERWALMRGLWRWATLAATAASLGIAGLAAMIAWIFAGQFQGEQIEAFKWGLVLMPLLVLAQICGAALRGLRRVVLGQFPQEVLRPALLLIVFSLVVFSTQADPTPSEAMGFHAASALLAFAFAVWLLRLYRPIELKKSPTADYEGKAWIKSALPLALIANMSLLSSHTDIIMLGMLLSAEDVGVYRIAVTGSTLIVFALSAINLVGAPHMARLYAQDRLDQLQQVARTTARAGVCLAIPVLLVLTFWGREILALLFGEEYAAGYHTLLILSSGQMINAAMGPVGVLLNMTGNERDAARIVSISAILNIVLNGALIPLLGKEGAALATALSLAAWNFLMWRAVHARLRIESSVLPIPRKDAG